MFGSPANVYFHIFKGYKGFGMLHYQKAKYYVKFFISLDIIKKG